MERNFHAHRLIKTLFVLIALATTACHREVALPPLPLRNITLTDKFFDVWPTSPTRAFIFGLSFPDRLHGFFVGDRALVLSTVNGGESFTKRQLQRLFKPELADYA